MDAKTPKLTKFLPSYVGSKAYWVGKLEKYRGRDFVEFFAGSAVISANLANRAVLNDLDPFLHKYFSQYERQPVKETFTSRNYFTKRKQKSWYRWLYYLQRMSFSGVYRWSKNGYNVPIKQDYKPKDKNGKGKAVHLKDEIERSIERFKELAPTLCNLDYQEVLIPENPDIAILDPPYESKQAAYNVPPFNYEQYWNFVRMCMDSFRVVIVFDWDKNIDKRLKGHRYDTRKMRVNGKYDGATEAMCIIDNDNPNPTTKGEEQMMHNFHKDLPKGHDGERVFHEMHSECLTRTDGKKGDFIYNPDGKLLELKSEISYSTTDPSAPEALEFRKTMSIPPPNSPNGWRQTGNLFVERYSSIEAGTPGGPWQAQTHGAEYYVHLFLGDGKFFVYRTDDMVDFMEKNMGKYRQVDVRNPGYTTVGFPVPIAHVAHLELDLFPARVYLTTG